MHLDARITAWCSFQATKWAVLLQRLIACAAG
jgi:hypothetical protein